MGMSDFYGPADEGESIATIHEAIERGVTFLNTGDFYGMGHNEMLIAQAIEGRRDRVFISVKFGALRTPSMAFIGFDARPAAVKSFLTYSLKRLKTDYIDLYQPARVDPAIPIEDTVGAMAEMVQAGYVRHLGLSEAAPATVRRAQAVHPIAALETEYAVLTREIEAYGVLSRGLIGGAAKGLGTAGDTRAFLPRFQGENLPANAKLVDTLNTIAQEKGATAAQLAIAWVLARGQDIIPLIGARTRSRLAEALPALDLKLTDEDLTRIDAAFPVGAVAGDRYDKHGMAMVNR
jgi:aryl-alcohol dehydrogenase-like predicted oxidoreductase